MILNTYNYIMYTVVELKRARYELMGYQCSG